VRGPRPHRSRVLFGSPMLCFVRVFPSFPFHFRSRAWTKASGLLVKHEFIGRPAATPSLSTFYPCFFSGICGCPSPQLKPGVLSRPVSFAADPPKLFTTCNPMFFVFFSDPKLALGSPGAWRTLCFMWRPHFQGCPFSSTLSCSL